MLEKIKKIDRNKVLLCLEMAFYLYCFIKMCLNLCYGTEAMYQTFRDYYNYKAIAYFLAVLLMVRRAKIWHPVPIIYSVLYVIGSVMYFRKWQFEIELFNANLSKCIAFGLFFLLIIDFFVSKNLVKWKERNKVLTIIFLVALALSAVISPGRASLIYFICPFAALYFIRINEQKWKQLMICLSIAIWSSNMWVMVKSLIEVPYEGERYFGVFLNLSTIGIFCAAAAVSATFWLLCIKGKTIKANILRIVALVAILVPTYFTFLVSARVALLALVAAIMYGMIMWMGKYDINKLKKKIKYGCVIIISCIILFFVILWGLYNIPVQDIKDNIEIDFLREQVLYWNAVARSTFDANSETYEQGTVLAMIDRFSSSRVGIWQSYFEEMTWLGHEGVYSAVTGRLHPHNNYIAWLYQYGLIGGSAFIVWFIYLNVCINKMIYKTGNKKYMFASLWCMLALVSMLTETILWIYLSSFILIFIQYIVAVDIKDGNKNED